MGIHNNDGQKKEVTSQEEALRLAQKMLDLDSIVDNSEEEFGPSSADSTAAEVRDIRKRLEDSGYNVNNLIEKL